jgi:hypothetical protein
VTHPPDPNRPRNVDVVLPDSLVPSAEGLSHHASIFRLFLSDPFIFRLKLRCDRGIPCGSCLKRGCGAICPDGMYSSHSIDTQHRLIVSSGSLTTGQGNRYVPESLARSVPHTITFSFVLASTQELHEKITELCTRVRDLEDALRTSHDQSSTEPHPLLSDELLLIKAPLQREGPPRNPTIINQQEEENNPDAIDSFGTLAINRSGHTSYYGQFANSWVSSRRFITPRKLTG